MSRFYARGGSPSEIEISAREGTVQEGTRPGNSPLAFIAVTAEISISERLRKSKGRDTPPPNGSVEAHEPMKSRRSLLIAGAGAALALADRTNVDET